MRTSNIKSVSAGLIAGIMLMGNLTAFAAVKERPTIAIAYTLEAINKKPELLGKYTGVNADYAKYLRHKVARVAFFNDKTGLIDKDIDVYTIPGSQAATSLYVYSTDKHSVVVKAKLDEFNGSIEYSEPKCDTALQVNLFALEKQPIDKMLDINFTKPEKAEKELKRRFIGRPIDQLRAYLKLSEPYLTYTRIKTGKILEQYTIVDTTIDGKPSYTGGTAINVIVDKGIVKALYLDNAYKPLINAMGYLAKQ